LPNNVTVEIINSFDNGTFCKVEVVNYFVPLENVPSHQEDNNFPVTACHGACSLFSFAV
jgi:hypothetical protein